MEMDFNLSYPMIKKKNNFIGLALKDMIQKNTNGSKSGHFVEAQ